MRGITMNATPISVPEICDHHDECIAFAAQRNELHAQAQTRLFRHLGMKVSI